MDFNFGNTLLAARRRDVLDLAIIMMGAAATNMAYDEVAARIGASDRLRTIVKTVMGDGSALMTQSGQLSEDFITSQVGFSAVTSIFAAGLWRPVPARTRLAISSAVIPAAQTGNSAAIPLRKLELDEAQNPLFEVSAIVVVSKSLITSMKPTARGLIETEMRVGAAYAEDADAFARLIDTGSTEINAASDDFPNAWRRALQALPVGPTSKIVCVMAVDVAKHVAAIPLGDGAGLAYPDCGPQGGKIGTIPVFVSSALAAGELLLIDADSVGYDPGTAEFAIAGHADLVMTDAPAPGAQSRVSLWQTNSVGMKITRRYAISKIREAAVRVFGLETTIA